jgi:hypothetical protein
MVSALQVVSELAREHVARHSPELASHMHDAVWRHTSCDRVLHLPLQVDESAIHSQLGFRSQSTEALIVLHGASHERVMVLKVQRDGGHWPLVWLAKAQVGVQV